MSTQLAVGLPGSPPARLVRTAERVRPAMRAAIDRLDPSNREIAAYHLGWRELDNSPPRGGGKGLRPTLALLGAEAIGAPPAVAVPGAVAVELVHNFSLLHDDVMDHDTHRRHRPTVWTVWGVPAAILAGDALLALAVEVLLERPTPSRATAAALITATTRELIHGQTLDLEFENSSTPSLEDCLAMAHGKTGVLLGTSAAIGAVLAGAPDNQVRALSDFGEQLGLAFQLVDDLLGIWGEPERTGKPVGSDLRAGKHTLPISWALRHGGTAAAKLASWLVDPTHRTESDIRAAADLVEAAGGRAWASAEAQRRVSAAVDALDRVPIEPSAHAELVALARFVVHRET